MDDKYIKLSELTDYLKGLLPPLDKKSIVNTPVEDLKLVDALLDIYLWASKFKGVSIPVAKEACGPEQA